MGYFGANTLNKSEIFTVYTVRSLLISGDEANKFKLQQIYEFEQTFQLMFQQKLFATSTEFFSSINRADSYSIDPKYDINVEHLVSNTTNGNQLYKQSYIIFLTFH